MYYRTTIANIRAEIKKRSPDEIADCNLHLLEGNKASLSYLLWMCDEIESMDTNSLDHALKAARWIGWILAHAELHGLLNNTKSRYLIRTDRSFGYDEPLH